MTYFVLNHSGAMLDDTEMLYCLKNRYVSHGHGSK